MSKFPMTTLRAVSWQGYIKYVNVIFHRGGVKQNALVVVCMLVSMSHSSRTDKHGVISALGADMLDLLAFALPLSSTNNRNCPLADTASMRVTNRHHF